MTGKWLLYALTMGIVVLLLELCCWGFFAFYYLDLAKPSEHEGFPALIRAIPAEDLRRFRIGQFVPILGWSNGPGIDYDFEGVSYSIQKDRIRFNPYGSDVVRIAAYGDSFTFGDEVEEDETFPYFLSTISKTHVVNYGVSAYGTDQALLRLERNLKDGRRTDVVILEIIQDSIKRNMNMYLGFKYGFERWTRYMFKPMLVESASGYDWVESPLPRVDTTDDVLRAYETAKRYDWFYKPRHPEVGFPYTVAAFRTAGFVARQRLRGAPGWGHEPSENKLHELIRRYHALSQEYDFVPVLVYIPLGFETQGYLFQGQAFRFNAFLEEVRSDYQGTNLVVVDLVQDLKAMGPALEAERFYVRPFDGHPSRYGNQVIAEILFRRIQRNW